MCLIAAPVGFLLGIGGTILAGLTIAWLARRVGGGPRP